jgi:CBS domain-containing protein
MRQVAVRDLLKGHTAQDVMMTDCPRVSPNLRLQQLVDGQILSTGKRCFPVMHGDQLLGLITVHQVKETPHDQWSMTTIRQVMIPADQLISVHPGDELPEILDRMTAEDVNQMPVIKEGELIGMVARDNVLNFIRTLSDLSA